MQASVRLHSLLRSVPRACACSRRSCMPYRAASAAAAAMMVALAAPAPSPCRALVEKEDGSRCWVNMRHPGVDTFLRDYTAGGSMGANYRFKRVAAPIGRPSDVGYNQVPLPPAPSNHGSLFLSSISRAARAVGSDARMVVRAGAAHDRTGCVWLCLVVAGEVPAHVGEGGVGGRGRADIRAGVRGVRAAAPKEAEGAVPGAGVGGPPGGARRLLPRRAPPAAHLQPDAPGQHHPPRPLLPPPAPKIPCCPSPSGTIQCRSVSCSRSWTGAHAAAHQTLLGRLTQPETKQNGLRSCAQSAARLEAK